MQVAEQQTTMQQVGVPGFHQTQNPKELKVQMYILEFIVRIAGIKLPPWDTTVLYLLSYLFSSTPSPPPYLSIFCTI